jgi:hypothetical protein
MQQAVRAKHEAGTDAAVSAGFASQSTHISTDTENSSLNEVKFSCSCFIDKELMGPSFIERERV